MSVWFWSRRRILSEIVDTLRLSLLLRLANMEVHLNPDVQARLTRLAAERGSNAEKIAREAIERFVDYDEWFIREVEKGLAQIEHGETLSHAEVGARLETTFTEKQARA